MEIITGNTTFNLDKFLEAPLFAHLATVFQGEPRESPVWFLWEEGEIWIIANQQTDTFSARLRSESKCAIGIVYDPYERTVYHAGFRGYADIMPFDASRARRLLKWYLGDREDLWPAERFVKPLQDKELS